MGSTSTGNNNDINTTHTFPPTHQHQHTNPPNAAKRSRIPSFTNTLSEDETVVKKFIDIIQYKVDNRLIQSPTNKEREIIRNAVFFPGFFVGCVVGLGSFVAMRRLPVHVMNRMEKHRWEIMKQINVSSSGSGDKSSSLKQINNVVGEQVKPEPFKETQAVMVIGMFKVQRATTLSFQLSIQPFPHHFFYF